MPSTLTLYRCLIPQESDCWKLAARDRGLGFLLLTITQSFAGLLCGPSTSRASVFSALTPDYAPGVADRFTEPPERVWFGRLPERDCQLGCEPTNCPS